jgi:hypothetical protein
MASHNPSRGVFPSKGIPAWRWLPRAGHVQDFEAKQIVFRYSLFAGVIDVQHWLPELVGKFQSELGPAAEHASTLKITVPSLFAMFLLAHPG